MSKIKALLAFRNNILIKGLSDYLESQPDMEVVAICNTGRQCVRETRARKPDIILISLLLEEYDSLETIRQIRGLSPRSRVIVVTYSQKEADLFSALEAGVHGHLFWPVTNEDVLVTAIRDVNEGGMVISPLLTTKLVVEFNRIRRENETDATVAKQRLSNREREVITLAAGNKSNKQIASELSISIHTVKTHISSILEKCNAHSRHEAILIARQLSIID